MEFFSNPLTLGVFDIFLFTKYMYKVIYMCRAIYKRKQQIYPPDLLWLSNFAAFVNCHLSQANPRYLVSGGARN